MHWRLVLDGAHSASWNMAMDEAMLDAVSCGVAPATVRIYTWDETAVTVGRSQNVAAGVNTQFCEQSFIPIVRRPTGGRGILHGSDVTASVAMPLESLPSECRSVVASYRYLSGGFVEALRLLGMDGAMGECERRERRGGDCFASPSQADVVAAAGQKLVGSAQRRRGPYLLQQSSIRYRRPEAAPADIFLGPVEEGTYPLENVPERALVRAVVDGFAAVFGAKPEETPGPAGWEEERCAALIASYAPLKC
jgi:lipoate-protein ligase A